MSEQHTSVTKSPITPSDLMARGFALFPLRPGTKVPAVPRDWERAATTSPLRLRRITPGPGANYGVACGPSNLVVVDLDVAKDGEEPAGGVTDGWCVLRNLSAEHGGELPRTFTVSTPSGGRHLYFRPPVDGAAPRNTVRRLGPLIDTRGAGGYVVAPGSRVDGVDYRVIDDAPVAVLPDWIGALLRPMEDRPRQGEPLSLASALGPVRAELGSAYARAALERETARVESARVGTRNDTLNRAAYSLGTLVGSGLLERADVEVELTRAARAAGLEAREVAATLRSGLTAGIARPRRLVGVGASAAASGVHQQLSTDSGELSGAGVSGAGGVSGADVNGADVNGADVNGAGVSGADVSRTLIPRSVPEPADWPRVFRRHVELGTAATSLLRELSGLAPGMELPEMPALSQQGEAVAPAALSELLTELDEAYGLAARASGPIAGSTRWQGILALVDGLRDLNGELVCATEELSPQLVALVRSLTSAAARQVVTLAREIAVKLNSDGLRHSPLWTGVRRMQRAAEAVADFGTPARPLTPSRHAAGRTALQTQLDAMRRSLQSSARPGPTAAAS